MCTGEDGSANIPFGFVSLEDATLGVVAQNTDVDVAAQVEFLQAELGHSGRIDRFEMIEVSECYR